MSETTDTEALQALVPLNALSREHFRNLQRKLRIETIKPRNPIFAQGESDKRHVYLLSGEVDFFADGKPCGTLKAGSPESRHPMAHHQPRQLNAYAKSTARIVRIDSNLLDILLTWDQAGTYHVEELSESREGGDEDWMTRILQTKAFHRIPPANIQAIFMRMEPVSMHAGDVIIQQGAEGDYFYIIKSGRCKVTRTTPTSSGDIKLAELGVGDSFGEEALISDSRRNATVTMLTDGTLMRLAKNDFIHLLNEPLLKWIDFDEAIHLIATEHAQWLDVRLPGEYGNGHIRGSLNIPLIFLRMKASGLGAGHPYLVYCDTGRRSSAAAFLLGERGFDVYVLREGLAQVPQTALETQSVPSEKAAP